MRTIWANGVHNYTLTVHHTIALDSRNDIP